jgi:hypothetical protein
MDIEGELRYICAELRNVTHALKVLIEAEMRMERQLRELLHPRVYPALRSITVKVN